MLQVNLDANVRTGHGKGAARTLRRMGQTPAVLYGLGHAPISLALDTKILTKELLAIQHRNSIVNLDVEQEGKKSTKHVLIKEVQVDPLKEIPVHADFCEISMEKPMTLTVPLVFTGKAKGVDMGGEMHIAATTLKVQAKPLDIPDSITVDVSGLDIGDQYTFSDLIIPAGVSMVDKGGKICVAVTTATIKKTAAEEAGETVKK
jgi:large subunit ribosomal protein L25